jgi:hypothetical protein
MRIAAPLVVFLLGGCASLIDTLAPPPIAQTGDIQRSTDVREVLRGLLEDRSVNANAAQVSLNATKLTEWSARSVVITKDIYQKRAGGEFPIGKYLGPPYDDFAIECGWAVDTPLWYSNYEPTSQRLRHDKNQQSLKNGTCTKLKKDDIELRVALFNFLEPFDTQVPLRERPARLARALQQIVVPSTRGTDRDTWEVKQMLVGEAAGYIYEFVPTVLHSGYERQTGTYYRLVLIGSQTMACIDVFGPKRMPMPSLQAFLLPVMRALSFE